MKATSQPDEFKKRVLMLLPLTASKASQKSLIL